MSSSFGERFRFTIFGQSHGAAIGVTIEGLPAGQTIDLGRLQSFLARRAPGNSPTATQRKEADEIKILSGLVNGRTCGAPLTAVIENTNTRSGDYSELRDCPRPGHADYSGMLKYGFDDARPVLERASARETAARVAAGTVARNFLRQAFGAEVVSHVISIGASEPYVGPEPGAADLAAIDASPVRAFGKAAEESMIAEIEAAKRDGDTLGGIVEVVVHGLPVGLGSFVSGADRLDSRLAAALMGIQAIKGVEVGDGFETARRRGSAAHDEMRPGPDGVLRSTNRAGGIEGGMTNGETLRVRAAMKPISTVPRALSTVDMTTGDEAVAIHQRSDVCAVPAAGVVAEAMVALVVAQAALEKFGGDSLPETVSNIEHYLKGVAAHPPW